MIARLSIHFLVAVVVLALAYQSFWASLEQVNTYAKAHCRELYVSEFVGLIVAHVAAAGFVIGIDLI